MDFPIIDRVFGMESGYVLDITNHTFADFFRQELNVNIDDRRWATQGGSKAKRLRYYLRCAAPQTALDTLNALWEYREATTITAGYPGLDPPVRAAYLRIIARLGGTPPQSAVPISPRRKQPVDATVASSLAHRLLDVSTMEPQARGYAFERFLKDVFDAYGLSARAAFRLKGEQIDGSFELHGQTYLLEARWRSARADVETLRAFNAKVEHKAHWSRGLIISQSGFTPDGLHAFGSGNRVVCMDGLDLHQLLTARLDLAEVIALKVRRAAESGIAFVPVRELGFSDPV